MPIQYETGSIREHHLVRNSAGLFDISHMGRFRIAGSGATRQLNRLISSDLTQVEPGRSAYGLICNERGGVLDDVFSYRRDDGWLVVVNAANRQRDAEWFSDHFSTSDVVLEDISDRTAMIAVQGPSAIDIVDEISEEPVSQLPRFAMSSMRLAGTTAEVGRTGYTGEDGVELIVDADAAVEVWAHILAVAASREIACGPIGLAARDSLRFEAGFALYGHELTESITPIEARLKWACALDSDFLGRDAMLTKSSEEQKRLATVRMIDRGVPREGFAVLHESTTVGRVASGMYAPTVDSYCANVFVPAPLAKVGQDMEIEIRDRPRRAVVVKRPLYKPTYR